MTTQEKDQTELDSFHKNRAALSGATAETSPESGSDVVSEMRAALKTCLGYLDEELRGIRGAERFGEERMRGFRRRNAENLEAFLKPVRAALDGAAVETPPEGGSDVVSEMRAALKICRVYLDKQSRNAEYLEMYRGDGDERGFHRWKAASIDAVLEPVRAALGGGIVETPPEDGSAVVPEMAAALKICRGYLDAKSQEAWNNLNSAVCGEEYEVYGLDAASIDAVLEPVCAALGGSTAETPPEGGYVVSEVSASLKICRDYLSERSRQTWDKERNARDDRYRALYRNRAMRIGAVLKPVRAALEMANSGPERETSLAATGKKARGRAMDGGMGR